MTARSVTIAAEVVAGCTLCCAETSNSSSSATGSCGDGATGDAGLVSAGVVGGNDGGGGDVDDGGNVGGGLGGGCSNGVVGGGIDGGGTAAAKHVYWDGLVDVVLAAPLPVYTEQRGSPRAPQRLSSGSAAQANATQPTLAHWAKHPSRSAHVADDGPSVGLWPCSLRHQPVPRAAMGRWGGAGGAGAKHSYSSLEGDVARIGSGPR